MFKKIAAITALLVASVTNASAAGFTGFYDYSTWSASETYGGATVSYVDSTKQVLTMMEPNSYPATPWTPQEFKLSHLVGSSGTVSFDWYFNAGVDPCCSGINFYVNGTQFNLFGGYMGNAYNWNGAVGSGHFSTTVNAGDTIAFAAFSADSCCGATTNQISNFQAPDSSVPEPASLALLGLGLAGVAGLRRRRAA